MVRIASSRAPRARSADSPSRGRCVLRVAPALALCASIVTLCSALPSASAAETSAGVSDGESGLGASGVIGGVGASGGVSTNVLQVLDANGTAAELLHRLTIAQLSEVLHRSVAELLAEVQALPGYGLLAGMVTRLESPGTTVQELIDALAAQGISAAPLEQLISRLLAGAGETGAQLRSLFETVLGDVAKDAQLPAVASELGVPGSVIEAAHFVPSTLGALAGSLGTTSERLGNALLGSGAAFRPPSSLSTLVTSPVETAGSTSTTLLGMPSGSGGLTIVNVSSTPAPAQTASGGAQPVQPAGAPAGNPFAIVSIRVTRGGAILETVRVPAPGRLAISASAPLKVRAHRTARGRSRTGTRRVTVASLATEVAAGLRTLTLHPRRLSSGRRITVTLATSYAPRSGQPTTIRRSVSITRAAGGRKHRA